ncbi:MAG TPA: hypothetical protein VNN22_02200 [Verrucomicrobiae bacterium]|nr:hypothetical protein [Verrucomicrobiae bacterium]
MTLREKLNWSGNSASRLKTVKETQDEIAAGKAQQVSYYWHVGETVNYAIEAYLDGNQETTISAAKLVVDATMLYFYGGWRETLLNHEGKTGHEVWKNYLWYDEVQQSLPFAAALSDWDAVARIAAYPPENLSPDPAKAKGEGAWGWGLILFLKNAHRQKIEDFLKRAEGDKAKRPKLLCPVLRALMDNDADQYAKLLLVYLNYYRKSEFKHLVTKLVSLEGTTIYHLGRKQGFKITLPENLATHVIRFED